MYKNAIVPMQQYRDFALELPTIVVIPFANQFHPAWFHTDTSDAKHQVLVFPRTKKKQLIVLHAQDIHLAVSTQSQDIQNMVNGIEGSNR